MADHAPAHHERLLRLFVEQSGEHAIMFLDLEGRITWWSHGAERIFGVSASDIIGQPFSRLFTEEQIEEGVPEHEIAVATSGGDDESGGGGGSGGGSGGGGGSAAYTAANEQEFMDSCVPGAGDAVCGCAWTEITETISYERFVEMENEILALGDDFAPEDVPTELVTIMTQCAGAS